MPVPVFFLPCFSLVIYAITCQPVGSWLGDMLAVLWPVSQPLVGSVVFSKPSSLVPLEDQRLPPLLFSPSASVWVVDLPVALWGIISGASRFIRSAHILEVCRTSN